jgi:hypothetical protein
MPLGRSRKTRWDDVILLADNILLDTIKKNTDTLIDSSKEVDLEFERVEN